MKTNFFLIFIFSCFVAFTQHSENDLVQFEKSIIEENLESQKIYADKIKSKYSTNEFLYYKLLLEKTSSNAILITNSKNDFYPLKILQITQNIRKDVHVISLNFLDNKTYQTNFEKKHNIKLGADKNQYVVSICQQSKSKVFISNTVNQTKYKALNNDLYLIGLAMEYKSSNQESSLEKFWLKTKTINWKNHQFSSNDKKLFSNFLPPLLTYYQLKIHNKIKDEELRNNILKLAEKLDKTETVNKIIMDYDQKMNQ